MAMTNQERWNWQLMACHTKGMQARKNGRPVTDNPYQKGYYSGGNVQRQRREYWRLGWEEQDRLMKGVS